MIVASSSLSEISFELSVMGFIFSNFLVFLGLDIMYTVDLKSTRQGYSQTNKRQAERTTARDVIYTQKKPFEGFLPDLLNNPEVGFLFRVFINNHILKTLLGLNKNSLRVFQNLNELPCISLLSTS